MGDIVGVLAALRLASQLRSSVRVFNDMRKMRVWQDADLGA